MRSTGSHNSTVVVAHASGCCSAGAHRGAEERKNPHKTRCCHRLQPLASTQALDVPPTPKRDMSRSRCDSEPEHAGK
jgi:hypothetical protein